MLLNRLSLRSICVIPTAISLFVLAGCSSLTSKDEPQTPTVSWETYQSQAQAFDQFSLNGKIGIRTESDSQTATFDWIQDDKAYTIRLKGPLGQGAAEVSGDEYYATLLIAGEPPLQAATPEELLAVRLGWALPVRQATYWIKGLPAPDNTFKAKYEDNRLSHLTQLGWDITYDRYVDLTLQSTQGMPSALPSKVIFKRDDLTLTLILRQWMPMTP